MNVCLFAPFSSVYSYCPQLLSNAQKFCEEGYVCVSVIMDSDSHVAIKISDTGCGIPKSFRNALFKPFRQADSSLTRPKQGTGLGLSIVKHLVQRMEGDVDVESVEGEGSTFTVKLPITVPNGSPARSQPTLFEKKRVKIVYRHERTARLLSDLWIKQGLVVTLTSHKANMTDLIKDTDVIWTDAESVKRSPALKDILTATASIKLPRVFIVHSDVQELNALEPALSRATGVMLVKRPIFVHRFVEEFQRHSSPITDPEALSPRVRFALPNGTTPLEERKVALPPPEPAPPTVEPEEEPQHIILLVEDNMVSRLLCDR